MKTKFVELTLANSGKKVSINIDKIYCFGPKGGEGTETSIVMGTATTADEVKPRLYVSEPYDDVKYLIDKVNV